MNTIIPISDLRRKFGEIEALLPYVESFTITKKGKPFAMLTATDDIKRSIIRIYAGAFKNTDLDRDSVWEEVLKKKSRKKQIKI
ncbi:MAG: hypothetical protein AAB569_03245 [Patescibacteria group bacterium]